MKTQTQIKQIAAAWRRDNGNETRAYKITRVGRYAGLSAKDIKHEIARQSELSLTRMQQRETLTVRERITKLIQIKLARVAVSLPDDGLSMGSTYRVEIAGHPTIAGVSDRTSSYARSCKYSPTHYRHRVTLSKSDVCRLMFAGHKAFVRTHKVEEGIFYGEIFDARGQKQYYTIERRPVYFTAAGHVFNTLKEIAQAVTSRLKNAA